MTHYSSGLQKFRLSENRQKWCGIIDVVMFSLAWRSSLRNQKHDQSQGTFERRNSPSWTFTVRSDYFIMKRLFAPVSWLFSCSHRHVNPTNLNSNIYIIYNRFLGYLLFFKYRAFRAIKVDRSKVQHHQCKKREPIFFTKNLQ